MLFICNIDMTLDDVKKLVPDQSDVWCMWLNMAAGKVYTKSPVKWSKSVLDSWVLKNMKAGGMFITIEFIDKHIRGKDILRIMGLQ